MACLDLSESPVRNNVPGHLVGQTRDGGEQGVGFGAPAESERPEPQDFLPLQQIPSAPLVGDQFLARDELFLRCIGRWYCATICSFVLRKCTWILDLSQTVLGAPPAPAAVQFRSSAQPGKTIV